MGLVRTLFAVATLPFAAGCGYIHFGRVPEGVIPSGEAATAQAYTNLGTENKILHQELALVRREGDTLRAALERTSGRLEPSDATGQLNDTARELAMLRASYAKLQAERAGPAATPGPAGQRPLSEVEEKLATTLRNFTQLQEENSRLRSDLDRARIENTGLAQDLKAAAARNEQAQVTLAQLNAELLAQKDARNRAEQAATAARSQLATVVAQGSRVTGGTPGDAGGGGAATATLQLAKTPPSDVSATAELRTKSDRILTAATPVQPATTGARRTHLVKEGDTLDGIARQYFNDPERWRAIYEANLPLLSEGRPLRLGMELEIPPP